MTHAPPLRETAPVSGRARQELQRLPDLGFNFDPERLHEYAAHDDWHLDELVHSLPREAPGEPVDNGPFEIACRLIRDYEHADPDTVRAVYRADVPLEGRDMLLEGRFFGLRFRLGVRVGGVVDASETVGGRALRRWGWNYRTLEDHLERGQMDFEIWKWLDTGEVEFRIHSVSQRASIPNPVVRLGFGLFGRFVQLRFLRNSMQRLDRLVREAMGGSTSSSP